eukprot:gene3675-20224_t
MGRIGSVALRNGMCESCNCASEGSDDSSASSARGSTAHGRPARVITDFAVGMDVIHSTRGPGRVVSISGGELQVMYNVGGEARVRTHLMMTLREGRIQAAPEADEAVAVVAAPPPRQGTERMSTRGEGGTRT